MWERHNTTIAVFGGSPGQSIEFKGTAHVHLSMLSFLQERNEGMAGNQVLLWTDLDSEIKTALLENVRVAFLHRIFSAQKKDLIRIPLRRRICESPNVLETRS